MNPVQPQRIVEDILTIQLPQDTIALWWLGQAGFVLRSTRAIIYLDPFLSDHPDRLVPPPFAAEIAPPADLVLCTHEHLDHLDPSTLRAFARTSPHARFVVPLPIVEQMTALDISTRRVVGVQPDEELDLGAVMLFPLPAMHGLKAPPAVYDFGFVQSGAGRDQSGPYRYLGYVIEMAGIRVYHAGDTVAYDGLVERLRRLNVDIALLPINGRSYFREQLNLVGNLDEREAADLAAAAGMKLLVPIHYEMFAANQGRPAVLVDYVRTHHPGLTCYIPAHGRRFTYMKGDLH
jgi:L-ascorbate 6-phosphate lactonase